MVFLSGYPCNRTVCRVFPLLTRTCIWCAAAILGINDAPKLPYNDRHSFQQILIIANTTRMVDRSLIEAGYTLGTNKLKSLFHVVIPAALPDIYRDLRVLLGWAWTYLIVSELIGTTSVLHGLSPNRHAIKTLTTSMRPF